jgi:hypothetical protein
MTPGRMFSAITSNFGASCRNSSRPSCCFRSITRLALLKFARANVAPCRVPSAATKNGTEARPGSPPGGSTLTTVAPSIASSWVI